MLTAYKYRIYPDDSQKEFFAKSFGCVRFVYNRGLEYRSDAWEGLGFSMGRFDVQAFLPRWKQEHPWLADAPSQSLQAALRDLDSAYRGFFRRVAENKKLPKNKRKDPGFPKFKDKKGRQSFQCPQACRVDFQKGTIDIPKCKGVKAVLHRKFQGMVKTVTVSMEPSGKCFASVLVEDGVPEPETRPIDPSTAIGVDVGVKTLAVSSDGRQWGNPKNLKGMLRRIKLRQRKLSRLHAKGKKQSKRYDKARLRLAKTHEKVRDRRADALHKLTHSLVSDSQASLVCVEDLNVKGMLKNHNLAASVADASFGELLRMLEYKCRRHGVAFQKVGRFFPSSKTCSRCGHVKEDLTLKDREWTCPRCGTRHDRDFPREPGKVTPVPRLKGAAVRVQCPIPGCGNRAAVGKPLSL